MISVHHVSKRFGAVTALDDVSLSVQPGERLALIGTNGSGKSTLLRSLCGLLRVEGRVELAGQDVALHPELALRRLSYLPQTAPPLDAPVSELVKTFCVLRNRSASQVAERAARLGLKLGDVAGTRTRDLSGGMKQKLLAAMALAAGAEVLVCDEPTANLDAAARDAFFEMVAERPKDAVLIVCSHRLEEVRRYVERVVVMTNGRVERDVGIAKVQELSRRAP